MINHEIMNQPPVVGITPEHVAQVMESMRLFPEVVKSLGRTPDEMREVRDELLTRIRMERREQMIVEGMNTPPDQSASIM